MATRGSRRTFLSFCRPRAELKITCSPSKSHHTGVTCGRPSGIRVPRLAKAFFWKRSRYFSGITLDMAAPLRGFREIIDAPRRPCDLVLLHSPQDDDRASAVFWSNRGFHAVN